MQTAKVDLLSYMVFIHICLLIYLFYLKISLTNGNRKSNNSDLGYIK